MVLWIVVRPWIRSPESDKNLAGPLSSSSVSAPAADRAENAEPEWEQRRFTWTLFASESVVQSRLTNTKPICTLDSNVWSQHGGGIHRMGEYNP